jgi:hypothetical protein
LMIALLGFIDNKDRGQRIPARISSCRATWNGMSLSAVHPVNVQWVITYLGVDFVWQLFMWVRSREKRGLEVWETGKAKGERKVISETLHPVCLTIHSKALCHRSSTSCIKISWCLSSYCAFRHSWSLPVLGTMSDWRVGLSNLRSPSCTGRLLLNLWVPVSVCLFQQPLCHLPSVHHTPTTLTTWLFPSYPPTPLPPLPAALLQVLSSHCRLLPLSDFPRLGVQ